MKKFLFLAFAILSIVSCTKYKYESVENDPMESRIYTLDNGLKVYLTVNKDQPRIQTYVAVRVGGKNDPSENTGLAHYLEHLMFKGTTQFGTSNWEKESPILDEIENLYEVYRTKTDPEERAAIYHQIDSLSLAASKFAIANEYDKLMAAIGSVGSNAYTSEDVTCYVEDIPSNEIENWAKVQSNRFKDMVIRGFHTELESVYEEKNISLTNDMRKVIEASSANLFPNHPYGTQTVLGTQEHLKNPSIKTIKEHFKKWYVPNNVAICMSGDFDYDQVMDIINQYFGDWQPNPDVEELRNSLPKDLVALKEPVVTEVFGVENERVVLSWAFPGKKDKESDYLEIMSQLVQNGKAGLFDIDLNQSQKVLGAGAGTNAMSDYSMFLTIGYPKEGQTLDEVKDLMLAELNKIKTGEFDENLLEATINNMKLECMQVLESNEARADMFVESFVNGTEWKDEVEKIDRLSKITKKDIMEFAKRTLTNGYSLVYKRQGIDPNEKKIDKPAISAIETNRDKVSDFAKAIIESEAKPIEPMFVDFKKDMSIGTLANGNELLYKTNTTNETFSLQYRIARGSIADKYLSLASDYIEYVGTSKYPADQFMAELYRLACNISVSVDDDETVISIGGLAENMPDAVALCEAWMHDAKVDPDVYQNLVYDELKSRQDAKLEQRNCFNRLRSWGMYGPVNPMTNIPSAQELTETDPQSLLDRIDALKNYKQTIVYYGPMSQDEITEFIEKNHAMADKPEPTQFAQDYHALPTPQNEVIIAPYDAKNIYMTMYANNGQEYNPELAPNIAIFNEYFGGGMNTIVFQELREARGLAYSASALYATPAYRGMTNSFYTYIISQNDKMGDCIDTFNEILENMPTTESAFNLAKESILKQLATNRTIKRDVLSAFIEARNHGIDYDENEVIYNKVKDMSLDDLIQFQKQNIKGRTYKYLILGDERELDMAKLSAIGPITRVSLADIFGY